MILKFRPLKNLRLLLNLILFYAPLANAKDLVFCHEDNESFPWLIQNEKGLNSIEMQMLEKN